MSADLYVDGGGIRGYSSLLILRKLLCFIAMLETGKTLKDSKGNSHQASQFWSFR
jgi:hypothetical protein